MSSVVQNGGAVVLLTNGGLLFITLAVPKICTIFEIRCRKRIVYLNNNMCVMHQSNLKQLLNDVKTKNQILYKIILTNINTNVMVYSSEALV